jgi:hypothetical protein
MMRFLVTLVSLSLGCNSLPDAFHCTSSNECTANSQSGTCEANGLCSVDDPQCTSGRRYIGAGDLDGECVDSPSLCSGFTGLACEGFEGSDVDPSWQLYTPNASFARDSAHVARGAAAGHFQLPSSDALVTTYAEIGHPSIPTTATTIAARALYYFPSVPPYAGSRLISMRQTESPYHHIALSVDGNMLSTYSTITGSYREEPIALPTNRWICVELVIDIGQPGTVRAYLDGEELTDLRLDEQTDISPALTGGYFGFAFDTPDTPLAPFQYWLDEVALDDERIGCTR